MDFNAKALLLRRGTDSWSEETVVVDSIDAIRKVFSPYEDNVEQVNLDKYRKIYFSPSFIQTAMEEGRFGVDGRCTDMNGVLNFLISPCLFVQCDDEKPVDLQRIVLESMRKEVELY